MAVWDVDFFGVQWSAYCADVGAITGVDEFPETGECVVLCLQDFDMSITCKSTFTRLYSCVSFNPFRADKTEKKIGWIEYGDIPEIKRMYDFALSFAPPKQVDTDSAYIIDPRIVRLYILFWFDMFRKFRNSITDREINNHLQDSIKWSIEDAREWLRRNKFATPLELADCNNIDPNSPENERYISDPAKLLDPYWRP